MPEGISVGGLASGLDTTSIINGLMQIERGRITRQEEKKKAYELKLTTFNDLKSKLSDFNTKAKEMDKATAFNLFKSVTSDSTVADIAGEEGATPGNFDVKVTGLASTLKVASKGFASATTDISLAGNFTLSVSAAALKADPTVTDVTIDITTGDTLKDVAAKINRAKGVGAVASVIQMGTSDYRLMLTAVDEGTKAFKMEPVAASGASILSDGLDFIKAADTVTPAGARESIRTDFDFRLAAGGPATAATTLSALYNGIGASIAMNAGDKIRVTGTKADGTAATLTDFTLANPATDTLQGLLTSIETAFGGAASVDVSMNTSGEVVVTDKLTGTTDMTMTLAYIDSDVSGSTLGLGSASTRTDFKNVISAGKKAFYLLNDISVSSQTNKDNVTIAGTSIQLKRVDTTQNVKLTLEYDKDAIQKKVQDFLDGYNMVIKYLDEQSKIKVTKKDDKNSSALSQSANKEIITKGPFAGDSSIVGLRSQLQGMLTNKIQELGDMSLSKFSSLASLGIVSSKDTGLLVIDGDTFKTALDADFEGVRRLFVTGGYTSNSSHTFGTYTKDTVTGVYNIDPAAGNIDTDKTQAGVTWAAASISGDVDNHILNSDSGDSKGMAVKAATTSGVGTVTFIRGLAGQAGAFYDRINNFVDGFMTETTKGIQKRIDDENTRIARLEKQVDSFKLRLTTQFSNLELSISKLQSQSAAFSSQASGFRR